MNLSKTEYPNRDALRKALDVYLDAMCPFVSKCLDKFQDTTAEELIRNALSLASHDNIEEKIEISDIAHLVRTYWYDYFEEKFQAIDRHYEARSAIGLIVEGRNRAFHRPWDLDPEFTRTQLFLIAEVLGKINRSDAQREVETIRNDLFENTTQQLVTTAVEAEKAEYEKSIAEVKKRLAAEEATNKKLLEQLNDKDVKLAKNTKDLEKLSGQVVAAKENKKQLTSTSRQLKKVQAEHSKCAERLTSTEAERDNYKECFETASKELKEAEKEWQACEGSLTAMRKLFTVAKIGDQAVQDVYPTVQTDSAVRILDRRSVDKKNYLLELLDQKQPTIIYVQSEKRIDQLLTLVGPEKAGMIGRHDKQTSKAEEVEILEKLQNTELIAVVSDTALSTLAQSHCVEHFVFCHLAPDLDEFFERCQSAFASEKNAYLHLIYESKQDIEKIAEKFLDENALRELYKKFRDCTPMDGNLVNPANLYDELCKERELKITKLGIETSLSIFEQYLRQKWTVLYGLDIASEYDKHTALTGL